MLLRVAVKAEENTFFSLSQESLVRVSHTLLGYRKLFGFWVLVVKRQRREAFAVTTLRTLSTKLFLE